MSAHVLSLDGCWELAGHDPAEPQRSHALPCEVPGHVHLDLLREGIIPEPFWRDNAEQCQWVEHWEWRYSRLFHLPDHFPRNWAILEFEGLDTFARIRLNGHLLGETANMFIPHWFEVGEYLRPGANVLEVAFTPPAQALADKPKDGYFSCFSMDRVYARKMQCTYGWDWVHRFVSAGIWRSVRLSAYEDARLSDVYVTTRAIEPDAAQIEITVSIERRTKESIWALLEVQSPDGQKISSRMLDIKEDEHRIGIRIPSPQLWWPNGHGGQPLYTCSVALEVDGGFQVDHKQLHFGIRTVELEEHSEEADGGFVFRINGRPIFAKGGNWVPADPFPSRISAMQYERLLGLARDAHVNMLRAWGGGIYEPEAFWNACDRMGILITQDFLLACAQYPEHDAAFMESLRREFAAAIRMLRNHPSLALWCGDNELGMNDNPEDSYWGKRVSTEISGPLCRAMDPSRPYRLTSPYGGHPNNSPTQGDCHVSAWYDPEFLTSDMADYRERISAKWGRFASEYALCGAPPLRSLLKFMPPEDIVDPEGRMWEYHTKNNPYSGIDMTHFRLLQRTAELLYGPTDDPRIQVRGMEYVQCEWSRLVAEALRRRAYHCSGVLFWMYNDCWPASGWSMVDYYGFPKAGYYGMKRGFQPVIAAIEPIEKRLRIWICNDTPHAQHCLLSLCFQPWAGDPAWRRDELHVIPPHTSAAVSEIERSSLGPNGVFACDLKSDANTDRALFYEGMPRDMAPPSALLHVEQTNHGDHGEVRIKTNYYARVVTLDADLVFSDNYFDLMPGEERVIAWQCLDGHFEGEVTVSAWNGSAVP